MRDGRSESVGGVERVGAPLGRCVGAALGAAVGAAVGTAVGTDEWEGEVV